MNYYLISLIVGLVLFFFSLYELYTGRSAKLFIVIGLVGAFLWVLPVGFANNEVEVPYIVADKKIKNINLDMKFHVACNDSGSGRLPGLMGNDAPQVGH